MRNKILNGSDIKLKEELLAIEKDVRNVAEKNPFYGITTITFENPAGEAFVVEVRDGRMGQITYDASKSKAFKGCEVLPVKLFKQRKCFFCPLFAVVYRAADTMAVTSMSALVSSFATLIALCLGIWIVFQTLTYVSSLTKQDTPKFLGNLVKQSFKFLLAFLLLQYTKEIYNWVINPLLQAGLEFGNSMLFEETKGRG